MARIERARVIILPWLMDDVTREMLARAIATQSGRISIEGKVVMFGEPTDDRIPRGSFDNRVDLELGKIDTIQVDRPDVSPPYPLR